MRLRQSEVRVGPIHALLPLFVVRVWPEVKAANHSDLASDMQVDLASNTSEPDEEMSMRIDGACHCGYIMIEGEADPEKTSVCHCTDCQKGTGSAFRVNVPVSGATFRISGQPTSYLKTTAESGTPRLLPALRLPDLFDYAGRGGAAVLHGARRHPAPTRPVRATTAKLVPLVAALGDWTGRAAQE